VSDYTQSTFFAPKDLLATGNPNKIIYGSDVDAELSAISTAIATKADVNGDAIGAGTPCTELSVDNLKLDANKIISTDTDGDIELEPDGTGSVVITKVDIADGEIDGTPIGANSASTGAFTTLTASGDVDVADKIVHTGDTNTSIRFPAADTVTVETAGSERLRIDASGDVGYNGKLFSSNDLTTLGGLQLYRDHATGSCYLFDTTAAPFSGPLIFGTNNAEAMRIDSSGQVSVTSSGGLVEDANGVFLLPSGELRVKDTTEDGTAQISIYNNNVTSDVEQFFVGNNLADVDIGNNRGALKFFANSVTERMRIDASGNLGVGTSSPTSKLHVSGTIQSQTGSSVAQMYSDGGAAFFASVGAYPSVFSTNGSEAMRIDTSGNLGVGTASPARTLHVNDVMRLEPRATAPSSPSAGDIFFNSSTNKLQCYDGTAWQDCF